MIFYILIAVVFTLVGIVLTLLIEWHYFNCLFRKQPICKDDDKSTVVQHFPRSKLPKELREAFANQFSSSQLDGCIVLNLFFQVLYKELKDTKKVRRWFVKKLSVEFEELLQKTTMGKLIDQITLKDLVLGTEFPLIKDIKVSNVELHESKDYVQELDVTMNLEYSGGFQLSLNADLVWGRSAYLAVQITRLSGAVRLQLTRQPFTHWSITFCQEPVMDFKVESQFQGRPVPQITSLIISQIRRAIKKKHTLPYYKVRFKPFFEKPVKIDADKKDDEKTEKTFEARLEVSIIECSRLFRIGDECKYYVTLAIDALSWSELARRDANSWMSIELEIIKLPLQSLGIVCKQELVAEKGKQVVMIDSIATDSPASQVDLRKGDVVAFLNGAKITSLNQLTKILKQSNTKSTIRVERTTNSLLNSRSHESFSRLDQQVLSLKDVETNISPEVMDDFLNLKMKEESEGSVTSSRNAVQGSPMKKMLLNAQGTVFNKHRGNSLEVSPDQRRKSEGCELMSKNVQSSVFDEPLSKSVNTKRTTAVKGTPDPIWEEKIVFEGDGKQKYLNVGVWSCKQRSRQEKTSKERDFKLDKDLLVGQVSIRLTDIANECANNSQGFHQQTFQLEPPQLKPTASRFYKLATHPGFDENLCYGDITLVFILKSQEMSGKAEKINSDCDSVQPEMEDVEIFAAECVKESLEARPHEFSGTQFKAGTACHLCGKKIWLKVAFQCKNCAMISHKKCVAKCHSFTMCTNDGAKLLPQAVDLLLQQNVKNPQIITTDTAEDQPTDPVEPIAETPNTDSSPTPPGSPKTSLQTSSFPIDEDPDLTDEDVSSTVRRLLQHPNDEMQISAAKEMGKELYTALDPPERKSKLNAMVKKVQNEIDAESINRNELVKSDRETNDPMVKTKLAFQMAKSDERSRALAVLLLHYFAGIQHCHELEEIEAHKSKDEPVVPEPKNVDNACLLISSDQL